MSKANIKFYASPWPQEPKHQPNIITDTLEIHLCHILYLYTYITRIKWKSSILNAHFQLMEIGILSQLCVCVFLADILLMQTRMGRPADWLIHVESGQNLGGGRE